MTGRWGLAACILLLLAGGCDGSAPSRPSPGGSTASFVVAAGGVPIGEVGNLAAEDLRRALLGEPPYPSGWEALVNELVAEADQLLTTVMLPDVAGQDPVAAACAAWAPLIGHTDYAVGAFFERQFFVAHAALLAQVAPADLRSPAEEAHAVAAAAAVEQLRSGGDVSIARRSPDDAIGAIGMWVAKHC